MERGLMARGRKGLGVEPLANAIRFGFTLNGEYVRETVNRPPTPANLKWANRLAADVRRAIDSGTFDFATFFPDSKRAQRSPGAQTFAEYAKLYLESCGQLAANTRAQFKNALAFWERQLGTDTPIADIRHSRLKALIGKHPWASWMLANNYLIPLRGVFALAVGDGAIPASPMVGIKNLKRVKGSERVKKADAFTEEEERSILARMRERYDPQVANYFDFAFATGMRPEELIELKWSFVELVGSKPHVRVEWVRSLGEVRPPKNNEMRDVELSGRALAALQRQAQHTRLKGGHVFENPKTGSPWNSTASQRDHYWNPTLKALGLRHRPPYAARHTRAARMLSRGANPGWCAKQLGHSLEMFFRVYAAWIDDGRGDELSKVDGPILPEIFHDETPETKNPLVVNGLDGRRDWTRTN